MTGWALVGAVLMGGLFAFFAFLDFGHVDSLVARALIAAFLIGFYGALVVFGTAGRRRTLSYRHQVWLGLGLALTIAALCNASFEGYALAAVLGLLVGATVDKWISWLPTP